MKLFSTIWIPALGFVLGFGLIYRFLPTGVPYVVSDYLFLAVLVGMDSIVGGIRAGIQHNFRAELFASGFLLNSAITISLVLLGVYTGLNDLYLAAVVFLGGRIFLNFSVIRRHWFERPSSRADS